jgi:hypothetical protein
MVGQDLNLPPQMMEIDLNAPGQDEDNPQEVIINPM